MDSEPVCSICFDRLNQSSALSILSTRQEKDAKVKVRLEPCKHEFHRSCIERWLTCDQKLSCAYCRTKAKLLICSSSNQVLKTILTHPSRSHSMHVSSGIMERTIMTILSNGDMSSSSSSRRRISRGNSSGPSYPSHSASTRSAFNSTASTPESDARTSSNAGGRWFMQEFRRLRERMENAHRNSGSNPITPSPSSANVLHLAPTLEQAFEQFAETVDIVSGRLTPST